MKPHNVIGKRKQYKALAAPKNTLISNEFYILNFMIMCQILGPLLEPCDLFNWNTLD